MVGNVIYLIFCKHISDGQGGHETLQTLHATFDGAYKHMKSIEEHFKGKDFIVNKSQDGSIYVHGPFGFTRMYYVSTRTIDE